MADNTLSLPRVLGHKTGNGSYMVWQDADGRYMVQIENGPNNPFVTAQDAYDYCVSGFSDLQGTMRGFSYLNAAETLEAEIA